MKCLSLLLYLALFLTASSPVMAAGPSTVVTDTWGPSLLITLLILYALMRLSSSSLGARLGWAPAPEALLLGVVVGPVTGLLPRDLLAPGATVAACAIGLLLGIRLDLRRISVTERAAAKLATTYVALCAGVAAGLYAINQALFPGHVVSLPAAAVLAAMLLCADPATLQLRAKHLEVRGRPLLLMRRGAQWMAALAIGLHAAAPAMLKGQLIEQLPGWASWLSVTAAFGLAFGLLATLIIRPQLSRGESLVGMLAITLFAAAVADELALSAPAIGLVIGMTIAPTRAPDALPELLTGDAERTLSVFLFLFIGMSWIPGAHVAAYLCVPVYLAARWLLQTAPLGLASQLTPATRALPAPSAALWSCAAPAAAMLADSKRWLPESLFFLPELFACLAFSLVLVEWTARPRARTWLLDIRSSMTARQQGG